MPRFVSGDDVGQRRRARLEVDVGHADDRNARRRLRAHGAVRFAADRRRGVAAGEVADEHPLLDEVEALRGNAVVVEAERADRAGDRGVADDVDEVGSVAEVAEHRRLQERAAGERDLQAHGAIELRRMAARLVDLQRELRRSDDEIEASGRRFRRGQQRQRFVANLQRFAAAGRAAR